MRTLGLLLTLLIVPMKTKHAESASQQISDESVQEGTLDSDIYVMKNLVQFVGSTRERRQPAWFRSSEFDMC